MKLDTDTRLDVSDIDSVRKKDISKDDVHSPKLKIVGDDVMGAMKL